MYKEILFFLLLIMFTEFANAQTVQYKFNGNCVDSVGNYDGTPTDVIYISDIAGVGNQAAFFNGSTSFVSVPNTWPGASMAGYSIWFKTKGNAKPAGIVYTGNMRAGAPNATDVAPIFWLDSTGKLCSFINDGTNIVMKSATAVNDDMWHHAVLYYVRYGGVSNQNLDQNLWLDGEWVANKSEVINGNVIKPPSIDYIYVGACNANGYDGMPDAWMFFNGTLDEFIGFSGHKSMKDFHNMDLAITEHPQNTSAQIGKSASLHVSHTMFRADSTYSYQWYKDGNYLTGKIDSVLSFASVAAADTGYYKCAVINSNGFTILSDSGKLSITPTSIATSLYNDVIKLYPNPVSNKLYITYPMDGLHAMDIYSEDGRLIMTTHIKSGQPVDVNNLLPGNYYIKVIGDGCYTARFSKTM